MKLGFLLAAAACALIVHSPADARRKVAAQNYSLPTETLIENVNGYTLDKTGALIRFNGLLIDDRGRVKQLLRAGDKREPVKFKTDARGRTMLPGFIEAHGDVMELGRRQMQLDLSDTASLADTQAKIRAWAAKYPMAKWIIGHGWTGKSWGEGPMPTAADIDAAVSDKPVWLLGADGRSGIANSRALQMVGVPKGAGDPIGGRIGRLPNGDPSGLFTDAARALVEAKRPPENPVDQEAAFIRAQERLAALGITMVVDAGTRLEDWQMYRRFGDEGRLSVRIYAMADGLEVLEQVAPLRPTPWLYDDRLVMRSVLFSADDPARGLAPMGEARIRNLISKASMIGAQSVVRAYGEGVSGQVLDAYAEMLPTYGRDKRYRIEKMRPDTSVEADRFATMGVVASVLAGDVTAGRFLKAGGRLAMVTGYPLEAANPFNALYRAVSGQEGPLNLPQVMAALTTGAAYAAFAEDRLGTLEPGKWADFILIDRDIFTAPITSIPQTQVLETWVGGKRVFVRAQ